MGLLDRFRQLPPPKPDKAPRSAAGRGHTQGFIELEELNEDLKGNFGLSVYDKMYRTDGDIRQTVAMACNPISAGTWKVVPYGGQEAKPDDVEIAAFVQWALFTAMQPGWKAHVGQMLPCLLRWGHVPYEQLWMATDFEGKQVLVPRKLDLRLPRTLERYYQDKYGDLLSVVQQLPIPLENLSPELKATRTAKNGSDRLHPGQVEILARDLVYYRIGAEGDNWEGVSLLRPAYKHWYLKDSIERIDAIAQEREAVGVPICYPPLSATPRQLEEMESVLAAMRSNDQGFIIAPGPKAGAGAPDGQGWLIEVIGYERTGSGRDPQPSLSYHTQKIAAAFLAEFMRLGHGQSGARATAEVQADPFLLSVEALAHVVEEAVQPLVNRIVALNFPNAEHPPKLQMSLVDSTSLSQLADYITKLAQVGALFPDQELEDFLRARADLPPANPESVKKRGKQDDKMRQEIVSGGGENGDAPGGNNSKAKAKSPSPSKAGGKKKLDSLGMRRERYRPLRTVEEHVDFDNIEDYLDDLPQAFAIECQHDIIAGAVDKAKIAKLLDACYKKGHEDVRLEALTCNRYTLSVRDMGYDGLEKRAELAARYIQNNMDLAAESTRLNRGEDDAQVQLAIEMEGLRSLKHVAMGHGQGAYLQGRHDAIVLANEEMPHQFGVLYVSLLDSGTCAECAHADDGVVRSFDDPVRLRRRPPNQDCFSTQSGHNYCRCLEVIVPLA